MELTKICTKCGEEKPYSEFYKSRGHSSGRTSWCKLCYAKMSKNAYRFGQDAPASTEIVQRVLECQGIFSLAGSGRGVSGKTRPDLWAWGCIPIEAKMSIEHRPNKFSFRFTPNQVKYGVDGFVILVANYKNGQKRFFVVPGREDWLMRNVDGKRKHNFFVRLDSDYSRAVYWELLAPYENAFHLIEEERVRISQKLKVDMLEGDE